ncbi:M20/M25/M40 family metallo-hydrolase [Hyphococcus luteus]|uniref:Peptidase M20 n=1 Tax=Hyphococcus luteus TaxID=2058213 RepID=A0A2S7K858_9PROT|nr:M20/M25/M40 family metallo-hydrolase [Marinicaulis flavus]PQA88658.1 peptidase M20 [Marinicaulis flavus]
MKQIVPALSLILCLVLSPAAAFAQAEPAATPPALTEEEAAIVARVEANFGDSIAFLEEVVNINSGTMNHEGVRAVGHAFAGPFEALGFKVKWIEQDKVNRAGHFEAVKKGDQGAKLLLIGHLDTVFAKDGDFLEWSRDGDVAKGPGVVDMKGGDIVLLYALKALDDLDLLDGAGVTVLMTGDEEMSGKPIDISRKDLIKAAKRVDVALNFEGGAEGEVVTSRRGASGWTLTTTGVRAHSSRIFSEEVGAGAIFEMGRILNDIYEALAEEEYLTFNPGVVVGGTDVKYDKEATRGSAFGKTNVVAQKVVVDGGLRFISEEQKEAAREKMREIAAEHLPETGAEFAFEDSYPAMSPTDGNMALLALVSDVSEDLGQGPLKGNDPSKRGAADISFAAPHAPASMDGLGPEGGAGHTPDEWLDIPSVKAATARAALIIYRLTREDAPSFE